ncbi:MAG: hypothetical protein IH840_07035 [Candidatus Heimdallarchaeota archaeon]|nr:hypothetical protein [Candidatus Heimdallarchaeota archaeon]
MLEFADRPLQIASIATLPELLGSTNYCIKELNADVIYQRLVDQPTVKQLMGHYQSQIVQFELIDKVITEMDTLTNQLDPQWHELGVVNLILRKLGFNS